MPDAPARPQIEVANPDVQPSDEWIRAVAGLLLADLDRDTDHLPSVPPAAAPVGRGPHTAARI
jgi:hypothetical protein